MLKWLRNIFTSKPHEHSYAIPITFSGMRFFKCDHPGCNACDTDPEQDRRDKEEFDELMNRVRKFREERKK
jgi:hypothetical protein